MLTLTVAGKPPADIEKLIVEAGEDDELKILVDGPAQAANVRKVLEAQGFNDVVPEDDDGLLYLLATKKPVQDTAPVPESAPAPVVADAVPPNSTGVLLSEGRGHTKFLHKVITSFAGANLKPKVLGLIDSAVRLAAYNSPSCNALKRLEASGVRVLVSDACADRMGITEALGAGVLAEMSVITDAVLACGKVISL